MAAKKIFSRSHVYAFLFSEDSLAVFKGDCESTRDQFVLEIARDMVKAISCVILVVVGCSMVNLVIWRLQSVQLRFFRFKANRRP